MRKHQRRVDGECAEYLPCLEIVKVIETAPERLSIECNDPRAGPNGSKIEVGGMFTKTLFNRVCAEPLQNISDGGVSRRPFPFEPEGSVQLFSVHHDEGLDAAI